jgi:cell division protein FtsN
MKMRRIALTLTSALAATTLLFVACVPEKKHPSVTSIEDVEQNALDAEQAELAMAQAEDPPAQKWAAQKETAEPAKHSKAKEAPAHKAAPQAEAKVVAKTRTPASVEGTFVVQIGAFKVKENAERLHQSLQGQGFKSMMMPSKNGDMYLVRLEPTKSFDEAQSWASQLKSKSIDSHIIHK